MYQTVRNHRYDKWQLRTGSVICSVYFHCSVNLPDEGIGSIEPNSPREKPEGDDHDGGVGEVQQGGDKLINLQLGAEVEDTVSSHIDRTAAWHSKWPPPPAVVFSTELEIDHHYGNLWAGDDQDDEHQEQEPKQVVELALIDGGEDEEQLNEASSKG